MSTESEKQYNCQLEAKVRTHCGVRSCDCKEFVIDLKPVYSEDDVKQLLEKLVNDFSIYRGLQIAWELPKWFETNKKKYL